MGKSQAPRIGFCPLLVAGGLRARLVSSTDSSLIEDPCNDISPSYVDSKK